MRRSLINSFDYLPAHPELILLSIVIVLTGTWVGLDAKKHKITILREPYAVRHPGITAGVCCIAAFFGVDLVLGVWAASTAWVITLLAYVLKRTKALAGQTEAVSCGGLDRQLPPLPVRLSLNAKPAADEVCEKSAPVPRLDNASTGPKDNFVKGSCERCGGHLEFASEMTGQTVICPHCKERSLLVQGVGVTSTGAKSKGKTLPKGILLPTESASASKRAQT